MNMCDKFIPEQTPKAAEAAHAKQCLIADVITLRVFIRRSTIESEYVIVLYDELLFTRVI